MIDDKEEINKEIRKEIIKKNKSRVSKLYKQGLSLGRICRETSLDISTVLFILRKCKIAKKKLYVIYETQIDRTNSQNVDLFLENEKFYLEKFFPNSNTNHMTSSYVHYWKEKYKKIESERSRCNHNIRNITCASCGKILADASRIDINV